MKVSKGISVKAGWLIAGFALLTGCSSASPPVPPASIPTAAVSPVPQPNTDPTSSQAVAQSAALLPSQQQSLAVNAVGSALENQPALPVRRTVGLMPLVDIPANKARTLISTLNGAAAQNNMIIVRNGSADARLKGYFSTFDTGRQTQIVYVWDVLDRSGSVIHRIDGREKLSSVRKTPWSNVPNETLNLIARNTISELAAWLASRQTQQVASN